MKPEEYFVEEWKKDKERIKELESECQRYKEALEKIKDGGIPHAVPANTAQRMFAMVDIATEALK